MPREFHRSQRLAEQIQRDLSQLVRSELRDPRLGKLVTITGVEVSRDLSHAKVFFSSLDRQANAAEIGAALQGAAGYLRSCLGKEIRSRTVPQLRFVHDDSIEQGARMDELIEQAIASDASRGRDRDPDLD